MTDTPSVTLGTLLREHRIALQFSQSEVGGHVGVSRHTVGAWELDRHVPWPQHARRLKNVLGIGDADFRRAYADAIRHRQNGRFSH